MRRLHWKKIPPHELSATVWQSSSFQEAQSWVDGFFDQHKVAFEAFQYKRPLAKPKPFAVPGQAAEGGQRLAILEMRRAQMIEIMLRRFRKLGSGPQLRCYIRQALMDLDPNVLSADDIEAIHCHLPSPEEEDRVRRFKAGSQRLTEPEKYFVELVGVPMLAQRIQALHYLISFEQRAEEAKNLLAVITGACTQVSCPIRPPALRSLFPLISSPRLLLCSAPPHSRLVGVFEFVSSEPGACLNGSCSF